MADDLFMTQTQAINEDMSICLNDSFDSPSEDESIWGKLFPIGSSFDLLCKYL